MLLREWYMHPNGQIPAYEWAFGDVNPPVHAWAALARLQDREEAPRRQGDRAFLERVFHKLLLNFTWWVNRKDAEGKQRLPGRLPRTRQHRRLRSQRAAADRRPPRAVRRHELDGDVLPQPAGDRAGARASDDPAYEDVASKFWEHFLYIADAMNNLGGDGIALWDEEDGFFYDVLHLPDGEPVPLKVRSMVGLIPLFAVETLEPELLDRLPGFKRRLRVVHREPAGPDRQRRLHANAGTGRAAAAVDRRRAISSGAVLRVMLDESEFLSPYGIRALSRVHKDQPYVLHVERRRAPRRLRAGRIDHRALRRQLELARADLVPGQLPADRIAAEVPPLLRRRLQGGVPDRLGPDA